MPSSAAATAKTYGYFDSMRCQIRTVLKLLMSNVNIGYRVRLLGPMDDCQNKLLSIQLILAAQPKILF